MLKFILPLSLAAISSAAMPPNCDGFELCKPGPNRELDCPSYRVISTEEDYQIREYDAWKWTSTSSCGGRPQFRKLFNYIQYGNAEGAKIDMTRPVVMTYEKLSEDSRCGYNVTMSFAAPEAWMNRALPAPLDSSVFNGVTPKRLVAVRCYEVRRGWGFEKIMTNMNELKKSLNLAGRQFVENPSFSAGYHGPWDPVKHNEVWLQLA